MISPSDVAKLDLADLVSSATRIAQSRKAIPAIGQWLNYPWDLIHLNGTQLEQDFRTRPHGPSKVTLGSQVAVLGRDEDVYIDPSAQIDPFVVIDARSGPVWIDAGVKAQPFTRIEGPCYIGRQDPAVPANVKEGTSLARSAASAERSKPASFTAIRTSTTTASSGTATSARGSIWER